MIPVTVLTGFLGSGKTTLLNHLLKSSQFARTAVIINEFGEVGLDHELVEASEENLVRLQTGCLCCAVRGDLERTLEDLLRRRDAAAVTPFERVVIETSGLADPAPILHALIGDTGLAYRLTLAGVVTVVDAVNGLATLERQLEAVKQVAVADRLVLTKTDLLTSTADEVIARLAAINPSAGLLTAPFGKVDADRLFDMGLDASYVLRNATPWLGLDEHSRHEAVADRHRHDSEISTFAIVANEPIHAVTLTLLLEVLAEHCGGDLLRMKGIVNVVECPERPAVIHGVQHLFHPPTWLPAWPSPDRRSRLVFVVRGIPQAWIETLLEALETEVREATQSTVLRRG